MSTSSGELSYPDRIRDDGRTAPTCYDASDPMDWNEMAYLNEVAQFSDCSVDWRRAIRRKMRSWGLDRPGNQICVYDGGIAEHIGYWSFVEADEVSSVFPQAVSHDFGPVPALARGYLAWWIESDHHSTEFGSCLSSCAIGKVTNMRVPIRTFDVIEEQVFGLKSCLMKHGYWDGDFFLRDEPEYMSYAYAEICRALAAAGVTAKPTCNFSGHNPIRLFDSGFLSTFANDTSDLLERHSVRLWGYNCDLLDSKSVFSA